MLNQNALFGNDSMPTDAKHRFLIFLLLILFASRSHAQTVTKVPPGDGTLSAAITAASPGSTLQLSSGGEYTITASPNFAVLDKPIVIEAEPGAALKPILKLSDSASALFYCFFIMKNGGALTLRGLEADGYAKADTAMDMLKFDGSPTPATARCGAIRIENCIIHNFKDNIVHGLDASNTQGMINDSVIITNLIASNAQSFLEYKYVSLGYLSITNSTIYHFTSIGIKVGNEATRKTQVTPLAFIDHCTFDDFGGTDTSMDYKGIMEVKDYYFPWTITNTIFSNFQDSTKTALNFKTPRNGAVTQVTKTDCWKCGVPPYVVPPLWPGYAFNDSITLDPGYKDPAKGDFTLPIGSPLLGFATDGGKIGDPRWGTYVVAIQAREGSRAKGIDPALSKWTLSPTGDVRFTPSKSEAAARAFSLAGRTFPAASNGGR